MNSVTLTLQLDAETLSALEKRRGDASVEEFLTAILTNSCDGFKQTDFDAASQRLILASKNLPYEQRLAIIAQVENALTQA